MATISENLKIVGGMAQGKLTFDADAARQAVTTIKEQSAHVPDLFEVPETDPKSEALPAIWSNWEDFVAKSKVMKAAADGIDTGSVVGLGEGLQTIGGICRSCHSAYRQ